MNLSVTGAHSSSSVSETDVTLKKRAENRETLEDREHRTNEKVKGKINTDLDEETEREKDVSVSVSVCSR